jgi:hypothetical protein
VHPRDASKLAGLAHQHKLVTRTVAGWTAVAKNQAALQEIGSPQQALADSSAYAAAMARLPGDAPVRAYMNGDEAQTLLTQIPGQMQSTIAPVRGRARRGAGGLQIATTRIAWLAADVRSVAKGLELEAFAHTEAPTTLELQTSQYLQFPTPPYTSTLVDEIPADVLAVADFQIGANTFELLPALPPALAKLFTSTYSVTVPVQLDAILGGETAIYVRPGTPLPEVTLVTQPADTQAAAQTLAQLQSELTVPFLKNLPLYHASIGGQFVVSTSQQGIDDFRAGGAKLSSDPAFLQAQSDAGMPAETSGFVYANLRGALPLLALLGAKSPAGSGLGTLLAYGARDSGEVRFTVFLGTGSS